MINNTIHGRLKKRLALNALSRFAQSHECPIHFDIARYEMADDNNRRRHLDVEVEWLRKETKEHKIFIEKLRGETMKMAQTTRPYWSFEAKWTDVIAS